MGMITYHGEGEDSQAAGLTVNRLWMHVPKSRGKVTSHTQRIDPKTEGAEFNDKRIDLILWFADGEVTEDTKPDIVANTKLSEEEVIRELKCLLPNEAVYPDDKCYVVTLTGVNQMTGEETVFVLRRGGKGFFVELGGRRIEIEENHFHGGLTELFQRGELDD